MNSISFPALGITFKIDPVAIDLPFLGGIRWYGIIIATGIILALIYCSHIAKKEDVNPDILMDMLLYALPCAIVFARAYYVIFSWEDYRDNLSDIFKIWEGGIAIYGGIIGAAIAAAVFFRVKGFGVLKMFDICALGVLIGQSVGRWGNFVNAEAFGGACDYIWGMSINGGECVHPTFLYESLWNALGFVILSQLHKKHFYRGFTTYSYLLWYGAGRFFIEGLRADSLYLGGLRVSQLVAILCVVAGTAANIYFLRKKARERIDDSQNV